MKFYIFNIIVMGIPNFFSWLVRRMENIILFEKYPYGKIQSLMIDMNGLIHPAVKDVNMNIDQMYSAVSNYLDNVINFANPEKLVYIAIDGVAPKAKMDQQRIRRYKSVRESKQLRDLNIKYGKTITESTVDFNMISPGTVFMNTLKNSLLDYIKQRKDINIILDSADNPGEGEHKIMNYIRQNGLDLGNISIYGLDADLMFLSLCLNINNITLLRESMMFKSGEKPVKIDGEYTFLDIDCLKTSIGNILSPIVTFEEISDVITENFFKEPTEKKLVDIDQFKLIMDYVYISFFLGNDFLPNVPSLKIRDGGLDMIILAYKLTSWEIGEYLISNGKININFLRAFTKLLESVENDHLQKLHYKKTRRIAQFKIKIETLEPYEKELEELNYIEHLQKNDNIKIGVDGWQSRYYNNLFFIPYKNKSEQTKLIFDLCKKYIDGTLWVLDYYQGKLKDWRWSFGYDYAPSIRDINLYLMTISDLTSTFSSTVPVEPYCQLMAILPPESSHLLPKSLGTLMTSRTSSIHYMYPLTYRYNFFGKRFLWECSPCLPEIDLNELERIVIYYKNIFTGS